MEKLNPTSDTHFRSLLFKPEQEDEALTKSIFCRASDNTRWLQSICGGPGDERLSHLGLCLVYFVLLSSRWCCYQSEARQWLSVSAPRPHVSVWTSCYRTGKLPRRSFHQVLLSPPVTRTELSSWLKDMGSRPPPPICLSFTHFFIECVCHRA